MPLMVSSKAHERAKDSRSRDLLVLQIGENSVPQSPAVVTSVLVYVDRNFLSRSLGQHFRTSSVASLQLISRPPGCGAH